MVRIMPVVGAHRVVEESEEAHNLGVGAGRRAGERDTVLAHALPVREAVEGRGVRRRAGQDRLENVLLECHRVSLDLPPGNSDG